LGLRVTKCFWTNQSLSAVMCGIVTWSSSDKVFLEYDK
uniref:Transmembrane protein 39A n=1 Tax=Parascaris univalens TaxID=6257 RepID=A0A915A3L1_PARUN